MTNQTLPPRSTSTPEHDPNAAPMRSGRVSRALSAHPRRSLLAVFLFVLVAGFFGGPLAGSLESSGGFASNDADSVRAIDAIEAATGTEPGAGIVIVVDTPDGPAADADRVQQVTDTLAAESGVTRVTSPTTTRGDPGTLVSRTAARSWCSAPWRPAPTTEGWPRRSSRRLRRAGRRRPSAARPSRDPARRDRRAEDLGPRRDPGLPAADRAVADLLRRPGRPDPAGRRRDDRARHVPGPHRHQRALRPEHLRAEPGHRPRPRPGHRLQPLPAHPLPRGAGHAGPDHRGGPHHDAHGGTHRRLLGRTVAVALAALTVFPLGFIKSMGLAGAIVSPSSRPSPPW